MALLIIIIFALVCLISLTAAIVKREKKRSRNSWLILFSVSLIFTVWLSLNLIKKISNVVKDTLEQIDITDSVTENTQEMESNNHSVPDSANGSSQIESLKSLTPDSLKKEVPASFFTYFGFRDWYRFPLVYPYSINCVDILDYGQLYNERLAANISESNEGVIQLQIFGIRAFTFDENLLLAKLMNQMEPSRPASYILFYFGTQKTETFNSEDQLFKRAREIGFKEDLLLLTPKEYSLLF